MMAAGSEGVIIDQILAGKFVIFSYLITDPETGEAVILDPGAEAERILEQVDKRSARPAWIVLTHVHPDHVGACAAVKSVTGASVVVHAREELLMRRFYFRLFVRITGGRSVTRADKVVEDGDSLPFGNKSLRILHTPGHSPGSICLLTCGNLFSGDTLFVGGVGRTDLPGASWKQLAVSLRTRILALPEETVVWPGHDYGGARSSTVGVERRQNPFVRSVLQQVGED